MKPLTFCLILLLLAPSFGGAQLPSVTRLAPIHVQPLYNGTRGTQFCKTTDRVWESPTPWVNTLGTSIFIVGVWHYGEGAFTTFVWTSTNPPTGTQEVVSYFAGAILQGQVNQFHDYLPGGGVEVKPGEIVQVWLWCWQDTWLSPLVYFYYTRGDGQ